MHKACDLITMKKRVKNPCKLCSESVNTKTGIRCHGACRRWAHFKCLRYTNDKVDEIKNGHLSVVCPCPDCDGLENEKMRRMHPQNCGELKSEENSIASETHEFNESPNTVYSNAVCPNEGPLIISALTPLRAPTTGCSKKGKFESNITESNDTLKRIACLENNICTTECSKKSPQNDNLIRLDTSSHESFEKDPIIPNCTVMKSISRLGCIDTAASAVHLTFPHESATSPFNIILKDDSNESYEYKSLISENKRRASLKKTICKTLEPFEDEQNPHFTISVGSSRSFCSSCAKAEDLKISTVCRSTSDSYIMYKNDTRMLLINTVDDICHTVGELSQQFKTFLSVITKTKPNWEDSS